MEEVSDDCRTASATSNAELIRQTELSDNQLSNNFRMGSVRTENDSHRPGHLSGQVNNTKRVLDPFQFSSNFKDKLLGRKKRESIN